QALDIAGELSKPVADALTEKESHAQGNQETRAEANQQHLLLSQQADESQLEQQRHRNKDQALLEDAELGPHTLDLQGDSQRWRQRSSHDKEPSRSVRDCEGCRRGSRLSSGA